MKFKKGNKYKCIETYIISDEKIAYIEGGIYNCVGEDILKSDVSDLHYMNDYKLNSRSFVLYANIPTHYENGTDKDVIDFCHDYSLNFCKGSAVKYIARAGKKDNEIDDLKKAIDFLKREIKKLEK
jgi:hypothetical protein